MRPRNLAAIAVLAAIGWPAYFLYAALAEEDIDVGEVA